MGNRLTRIITRTGDDGSTGLATGNRVPKDSLRITAMGDVDELNSMLGLLRSCIAPHTLSQSLLQIQNDLFDLGGELAMPGESLMSDTRVPWLEEHLETLNGHLSPLKEFILPGGGQTGALCHLARSVCRRAERSLVRLSRKEPVTPIARQYLNRLSDLLFVMARVVAADSGEEEVFWKGSSTKPK